MARRSALRSGERLSLAHRHRSHAGDQHEHLCAVDFETLESKPAHDCAVNDIADCRILLGRPTSLDLFSELPATGNFVLVSAVDGTTVAGGVITWAQSGALCRG